MSTRRLTTEKFIEKARKVHGDRYGYDYVEYKNSRTNVNIECPVHGVFEQLPNNHLKGAACKKCSDANKGVYLRKSINDFINKSKEIHGNKYDYSLVEYQGLDKKIKIICLEHGIFDQTAYSHMQGRGCYECGVVSRTIKKTHNKNTFVNKAKQVHGDKYDYSLVDYKNNRDKVKIICKIHGVFEQKPNAHLCGHGCVLCKDMGTSNRGKQKPTGWNITNWERAGERSKNFDSFKVYVIKCWNEEEDFYKIGRTFLKTNSRFKCISRMPYNYEIINEFIFETAKGAFDKENELKKLNKKFKYLPKIKFDGMYECFIKIKEITNKIEKEYESKN